jgi:hypothetical protein
LPGAPNGLTTVPPVVGEVVTPRGSPNVKFRNFHLQDPKKELKSLEVSDLFYILVLSRCIINLIFLACQVTVC